MLIPCKYHLWGHCRNKSNCKFNHNVDNCPEGLLCPDKGDKCRLRHVKVCQKFLTNSCGFFNKNGVWKQYLNCSFNHQVSPPVIQRWRKCDNLATRNDKEKIKILTINDSFKVEEEKGEQSKNRSKTNLLAIALLTVLVITRAELINSEQVLNAVGSSGKINLLATILLIVLILVERTEQIISVLAKLRISLGKALAGDVQGKIEKRIIALQAKVRVVKTLHDKIKKLEGKITKLRKCRTETTHVASNNKPTKQRHKQLVRRKPDGTKVCRNCYATPCLHGKQVTWESLNQQLSSLILNKIRTRVQREFNGAPLKDDLVSGIKGHIWSYDNFDVWLNSQDTYLNPLHIKEIKDLKYNCLE